jgi:hypothetical protein
MRSIPPRLAFLGVINIIAMVVCGSDLRIAVVVAHTRELNLHAVHAVDTVNEQDQYENERNLDSSQIDSKTS